MYKLMRNLLWALWFDENAAKRWLAGLAAFTATLVVQIVVHVGSVDALLDMSPRALAKLALGSAIGLVLGMLPAPALRAAAPSKIGDDAPTKPIGPAGIAVLALLSLTLNGCAFLKTVGGDLKQCAGQTIEQAQWSDLQTSADSALHQDWTSALASLEALALRYGGAFVNCVVSDLRQQYFAAQGTVTTSPSARAAQAADRLAMDNATRWLNR